MKKMLNIALALLALAFLGTGCASSRHEGGSNVQFVKSLDNGKPILSNQPVTKHGGGFLIFPLGFASRTGALEKFRKEQIAAHNLTLSGVSEDGRTYRKCVVDQGDDRSHGMWFIIGWYRVYNMTVDLVEFPVQNNAPPTAVSSDMNRPQNTSTPVIHSPPLSSN